MTQTADCKTADSNVQGDDGTEAVAERVPSVEATDITMEEVESDVTGTLVMVPVPDPMNEAEADQEPMDEDESEPVREIEIEAGTVGAVLGGCH